jgi:hypothetical protein
VATLSQLQKRLQCRLRAGQTTALLDLAVRPLRAASGLVADSLSSTVSSTDRRNTF